MKVKKGDTVLITSGKDRGKRGKVLDVVDRNKIVVEGANIRKKHVRPKKSGEKGQIIEKPAAFALSNAKLICPKCGESTRVGYKISGGRKYRACKKCQNEV